MSRASAAEVRSWARASGLPVGARGRIPAHLWTAYRRAQAARRLALGTQVASVVVPLAAEALRRVARR